MKQIEKNRSEVDKSSPVNSFLNYYFDNIYVVNLKFKIVDRLTVTEHLKKHGINFEVFEATNGYEGEAFNKFKEYEKRELGDLKRYPKYSETEKRRGHPYIESAGAVGYIYTYLRILEDAKKSGYKRFLILEDDILLSENFERKFKNFIQSVDQDWKILLLGASQFVWDSIDLNIANKKGFYFPESTEGVNTYGSFAIAFDFSIIDELIEAESAFEATFDYLPLGELYERYFEKCFVAYPNIIMPDVSTSTLRDGVCQYTHSKETKWLVEKFDYPLNKPSISVLIASKNNLKYYSNFSNTQQLPFSLRLFFNSNDGLRPLHNTELLDAIENKIQPFNNHLFVPESDYLVTIDAKEILTESDIVKFIEYKTSIREENTTALKEIEAYRRTIINGRVSVIIPTYKSPKNLRNTLESVAEQDYHNIEIIVVSDNKYKSNLNEETRQIVNSFKYSNCKIVLLEHTVNRNSAAARNTGILSSTGEYICFLDDDNIYLQGRLSKSIEILKTTNKTVGAIYCGFLGWNSLKNDLNRYKTGNLTLEILLLDYKKHYLHSNTTTYKREAALNINGFDESYHCHQDFEFNLRFFEQYTIEAIKESLVQLNPKSIDINNLIYNLSTIEIKQKSLNQFSYIIQTYDNDVITSIYETNWLDARRYISDIDAFSRKINENTKVGLIHILRDKLIDIKIAQNKLSTLTNRYNLIMKLISNLTKVSVKTKPLQKISAYKTLIKTYHKLLRSENEKK